jgi:hypothetical protein
MSRQKEKPTTDPKPTGEAQHDIVIRPFQQTRITVALLGVTPLVCNRQSEKTKRELLLPAVKVKGAARERVLKHDPLSEFRASIYRDPNPEGPTLILMKGGAFKSAACDSAVDTAELKAAQVRRLVSVPDYYVSIYGVPKIWMTDVRQAGLNRTPDIRTRAILPEWCALVTYTYIRPQLNETKLLHLIANGGMTRGIGDGRTEKGALDFGKYTVVSLDDAAIRVIRESGGRAAQLQAMEHPMCYDQETEDLLAWYTTERASREAAGIVVPTAQDEEEEV